MTKEKIELLSQTLLEIICCPDCHGNLTYYPNEYRLQCNSCKKEYEIKEGIPVLISHQVEH